jgi:acetyl esterase
MKKKFTSLLLLLCFYSSAFAQRSNLNKDYSQYLPEVRNFNKMITHLPQSTILTKEALEKSRQGMKAFVNTNTVLKPVMKNINGPAGNIALTIFKPDTVRAVVLDIHGGGWIQGAADNDAQFNDELARTCKVAVVSVDYRLAPENPFPACIEDCKAAAKWLVQNAKTEFGTDKLFIQGASAGGHLAAIITLYIRDSLQAIDKVKGANLMYGIYDLGRTPSDRLVTDSSFLPKKNMEEIMQLVFGNLTMEQKQDPHYSPLYADLHNLPPALFTVGAADPLADDTYFMEVRWRMAGNKTYLAVYPESPHGFDSFPTQMAKIARSKMYEWVNDLCQ